MPQAPSESAGDVWQCSHAQKNLILDLVEQRGLEKSAVDDLAKERFGVGAEGSRSCKPPGSSTNSMGAGAEAKPRFTGKPQRAAPGERRAPTADGGCSAIAVARSTWRRRRLTRSVAIRSYTLSASRLKSYLTRARCGSTSRKSSMIKKPTTGRRTSARRCMPGSRPTTTGLWQRRRHLGGYHHLQVSPKEFLKTRRRAANTLEGDGERAESLAAGDKLIRAYLDDEFPRQRPKPIGVEVRLEADILGIAIPLVGVADLVHVGNRLTDFKTTGVTPNPTLEAWQHELQGSTAYDSKLIGENTGNRGLGIRARLAGEDQVTEDCPSQVLPLWTR